MKRILRMAVPLLLFALNNNSIDTLMNIWHLLFGKPEYIEDDVFGRLQWISIDRKNNGYFEGRCQFGPTGNEIDILLDATPAGPTGAQKKFYQSIEAHYAALIVVIQVLIVAEYRKWEGHFAVNDFRKEFWPVSVSIPRIQENQPVEWEFSFDSQHDPNHTCTVLIRNLEPYMVRVDG